MSRQYEPAAGAEGAHRDLEPRIEFSDCHGFIKVRDRRVFRRGHEAFCRRLVESAARQPDIRAASVDLGSVTCCIEFDSGGLAPDLMAKRFVDIVQEAIQKRARDKASGEEQLGWATISAFPAGERVSCWQAVHEAPDRLRLHNEVLRLESSLARRVARLLREAPGIVYCRVVSFGRDLRIGYDPSQRAALAIVDSSEICLQRVLRSESSLADKELKWPIHYPAPAIEIVSSPMASITSTAKRPTRSARG